MIRLTNNMEIVNEILAIPEIWADIAPEGIEPFDIPHDPTWMYFLVGDGDGIIIFHPFWDGVKIHPNIVPEKRGKNAYRAIEDSIQAVFKSGCVNVYAEIARELTHVRRCARHLGFKHLYSGDRDILVRRNLDS